MPLVSSHLSYRKISVLIKSTRRYIWLLTELDLFGSLLLALTLCHHQISNTLRDLRTVSLRDNVLFFSWVHEVWVTHIASLCFCHSHAHLREGCWFWRKHPDCWVLRFWVLPGQLRAVAETENKAQTSSSPIESPQRDSINILRPLGVREHRTREGLILKLSLFQVCLKSMEQPLSPLWLW